MEIVDTADPGDSRIPSDLDIQVILNTGTRSQKIVLESEVIVPISDQVTANSTTEVIGLQMPPVRADLIAIDENLDGSIRTDYVASALIQTPEEDKKGNQYILLK
jgi:hypothetical protein